MPHINRIRVNNVKYNFGTQSYEDFLLKPFGHNMLYDLANGGGKSVLMLLMLQNVLPNCSLDDKQPVEKLFRTGDGSQTIHSLIEWKLDESDVVNGFRYMTTGFCARKTQNTEEQTKETASIEYFNYCIFYRDYNANDIRNLPLVKNKEKITYSGLRKLLKELERDNSLIVKVFDRKGEYQAFIADYGLYESEWEIIRGINKTEGHVRTYFETNYKTTRKVIENLLIEEIIQKSFRARSGQESEDTMSKTLLEMKDKLMELSKKKNEIGSYDRQAEVLNMFSERLQVLREVYANAAQLRREIAVLYQSAGAQEKECEKKKEELAETLGKLSAEMEHLQERIDSAKYFEDKSKAKKSEQEMLRLQDEVGKVESFREKLRKDLILKESMNDYIEYLQEKAKRDETAAELQAMKTEKSTLLEEVRFLTHHMKNEIAKRQKKIGAELSALDTRYSSLRLRRRSVDERERKLAQEIAVYSNRLEEAVRTKEGLNTKLADDKRKVGLLLFEENEKVTAALLADIEKLQQEMQDMADLSSKLSEQYDAVSSKLLETELLCRQLESEQSANEDFFAEYDRQKAQIERLVEVYGVHDEKQLCDKLREKDVDARAKLAVLNDKEKELSERIAAMADDTWGGFIENLPGMEERKEYIRVRHKIAAKSGREYLAEKSEEQRAQLLADYPFLPYAIVAEGGIEELMQDAKLRDPSAGIPLYPIVKEAALRNGRELLRPDDIGLFGKDYTTYLSEEALEKEKASCAAELAEVKRSIRRLEDQRETYYADEDIVRSFLFLYDRAYRENRRIQEEKAKRLEEVKASEAEIAENKSLLASEREALQEKRAAALRKLNEWNEDIETLKTIKENYARFTELERQIVSDTSERDSLVATREQLLQELAEMESETDEVAIRKNSLRNKLEQSDRDWQEKYRTYDVPGEYGECTLLPEDLENELNGKRMAYEREHAQEDDKSRLMNSYISAMNRCLKAINTRNVSVSSLRILEEKNELYETPDSDITRMRDELTKAEKALTKLQKSLEEVTGTWNRLYGKTGQLAEELNERYGGTLELSLEEDEIEGYIADSRSRLSALTREAEQWKKKERELSEESVRYVDMKKDIERMARGGRLSLEPIPGEEEEMSAEELSTRFRKVEAEYDRIEQERAKRQEEFRKNRQKVIDTLAMLDADSLAEEMKSSIQLPEDERETAQMMKNLEEVCECLKLEKNRIETGIADIVGLKENFENQCLQRCVNIKTELDRLPKLSRITLDGEQIPMISLQIPYVKEEAYKERMSRYIDEIVANADQFRESQERLQYIRGALSFKKLFSVIVSDMNAIRLSLYKRERIKEQSRHLRYEEAVGSTGQSQGIYIQFLIAIINYITNINSGKAENNGLYKVIFIDNPFGAAKDIYIWEPIFELLKTNQVQLIVPARGTTPAITGRFDVNYILGQKLIDGRQQTVVVDYHSSVETDKMEYIPLQFEQESFDFI